MYYDQKECGDRIRKLIKMFGYTQEEFADRMNVTPSHIKKIVQGRASGSIDLLVEMSNCFGVSMDYLLLGRDKDNIENKDRLLKLIQELSEIARSI